MKIKVDENIGQSGIEFLRPHHHDVMTVREQGLGGASDPAIFEACREESRILITLDRDFGHTPRFPPSEGAGIVVLDLGGPASLRRLHARLGEFLRLAASRTVVGELDRGTRPGANTSFKG